MRLAGNGEVDLAQLKGYISVTSPWAMLCLRVGTDSLFFCGVQEGEKHARTLAQALEQKLKEEDVRRGHKARAKFAGGRT
jgi:hypothetical protein